MLIPVDTERLGVLATGHVEPVFPWVQGVDGRRSQAQEQERDQVTGLPLWTVHGLIPIDTRPTLIGVRVPARECPQPAPYAPVGFERLECNARADKNGKLATYWNAAGMADLTRPGPAKSD